MFVCFYQMRWTTSVIASVMATCVQVDGAVLKGKMKSGDPCILDHVISQVFICLVHMKI